MKFEGSTICRVAYRFLSG